jgi:Fur family ferric uptake transcriptional regulator
MPAFRLPVAAGNVYRPTMVAGIQSQLDDFIRRMGLRRTGQREIILRSAFSQQEHFTAEDLLDRVRKIQPTISRATVYRTLGLMVEAGLLREIDLGGEQTTYDPNFLDKPSHNHLVCIDCGRVVEFEDAHIELLNDCVTRRLGFKPLRQSLKIEANCEQLRVNGRCPNLIATRLSGKRLRKKR